MKLYYYRCPKCKKRVGQPSTKYAPWCWHGNTEYDAHKPSEMTNETEPK